MAKGEKAAVALVVGAALGYAAGVLTAPKSGKETREDIKVASLKFRADAEKKLAAAKVELEKQIEKANSIAKDLSGKGQKELEALVSKGKMSQAKANDVLKAVKSGDSDDKDLKKAVSEVKEAKKHLWDYLNRK